jgi:hypothetical protein
VVQPDGAVRQPGVHPVPGGGDCHPVPGRATAIPYRDVSVPVVTLGAGQVAGSDSG